MELEEKNIIKLSNGNIKLVAEDGYVIKSKVSHLDEETNTEVPNVEGTIIYLGKNDSADNYIKVQIEIQEEGE